MDLQVGMTEELTERIGSAQSAQTLGSGSLKVYGSPAMVLLMEKTAVALLEGHLDPGMTSVGTKINMDHVSASPMGCLIRCKVELVEIDRKKLTFAVEVRDPAGLVGKGSHERFIVDAEKFQQRTDDKL